MSFFVSLLTMLRLFRQQFRRDLRNNRFGMDFARSAASALSTYRRRCWRIIGLCGSQKYTSILVADVKRR